jgi:hypothetical protein
LSEDVTAGGGEGCHSIHSVKNKEKKTAEHTNVAHSISFISFYLSFLDLNNYALQFGAAGSSKTLLFVYRHGWRHTSQMAVTFIGLTLI